MRKPPLRVIGDVLELRKHIADDVAHALDCTALLADGCAHFVKRQTASAGSQQPRQAQDLTNFLQPHGSYVRF